jgi:ABC-type bacteriocin/lantibiotic exporter with double-glycine peptidase domain
MDNDWIISDDRKLITHRLIPVAITITIWCILLELIFPMSPIFALIAIISIAGTIWLGIVFFLYFVFPNRISIIDNKLQLGFRGRKTLSLSIDKIKRIKEYYAPDVKEKRYWVEYFWKYGEFIRVSLSEEAGRVAWNWYQQNTKTEYNQNEPPRP